MKYERKHKHKYPLGLLFMLAIAGCAFPETIKQDACATMLSHEITNTKTLAVMKEVQTQAIKDGYSSMTQALTRNGDKLDDLVRAINQSHEAVIIEHRPQLYIDRQ